MRGVLVTLLLVLTSANAMAQCMARDPYTGRRVPVFETAGETMGGYAIANWTPFSPPTIIYGPRFFALPPLLQEFVKQHECAHLNIPTSDEIQANCAALQFMRRRGLSAQAEGTIARWTISEGIIGFQYGGTGNTFWNLTIACAGPLRR